METDSAKRPGSACGSRSGQARKVAPVSVLPSVRRSWRTTTGNSTILTRRVAARRSECCYPVRMESDLTSAPLGLDDVEPPTVRPLVRIMDDHAPIRAAVDDLLTSVGFESVS